MPPSDTEKYLYADRNLALIIRTSLASFGALLISQGRFIVLRPQLLVLVPLIAFTLAYYVISLCVNFGTHGFDMDGHRRFVRDWRPRSYPTLDVFLPVCGEPIEVLRNTWVHVYRLLRAYPVPRSLTNWPTATAWRRGRSPSLWALSTCAAEPGLDLEGRQSAIRNQPVLR